MKTYTELHNSLVIWTIKWATTNNQFMKNLCMRNINRLNAMLTLGMYTREEN